MFKNLKKKLSQPKGRKKDAAAAEVAATPPADNEQRHQDNTNLGTLPSPLSTNQSQLSSPNANTFQSQPLVAPPGEVASKKKRVPLSERLKKMKIKDAPSGHGRKAGPSPIKRFAELPSGSDQTSWNTSFTPQSQSSIAGPAFSAPTEVSSIPSPSPLSSTGPAPAPQKEQKPQEESATKVADAQTADDAAEMDPIARARKQWAMMKGSTASPDSSSGSSFKERGNESLKTPRSLASISVPSSSDFDDDVEFSHKVRWSSGSSAFAASSIHDVVGGEVASQSPNSPRIQRILSRKASVDHGNDDGADSGDQKLYQVVHEFTADAEDELTVMTGDIVEVVGEEDGWFLAKVWNDDGSVEEGLVPVSYCQEYNADLDAGSSARSMCSPTNSDRGSYHAKSPKGAISPRRLASPRAHTSQGLSDDTPFAGLDQQYIHLRERVNAKFAGNRLEQFGVRGDMMLCKAETRSSVDDVEKTWQVGIVSADRNENHTTDKEGANSFRKTRFYFANSMKHKLVTSKNHNVFAVKCDTSPEDFKERSAIPLIAYLADNSLCQVPLLMQISWCRRSISLFEKKVELMICVDITPSPLLPYPLRDVVVTVTGLPKIKVKPGAGGGTTSEQPTKLASSPPCIWCPSERALRWTMPKLHNTLQFKATLEEDDSAPPEEVVLKAAAQFHSSGSLCGFGIGPCPVYKSTFQADEYVSTSDYAVPMLDDAFFKEG